MFKHVLHRSQNVVKRFCRHMLTAIVVQLLVNPIRGPHSFTDLHIWFGREFDAGCPSWHKPVMWKAMNSKINFVLEINGEQLNEHEVISRLQLSSANFSLSLPPSDTGPPLRIDSQQLEDYPESPLGGGGVLWGLGLNPQVSRCLNSARAMGRSAVG